MAENVDPSASELFELKIPAPGDVQINFGFSTPLLFR